MKTSHYNECSKVIHSLNIFQLWVSLFIILFVCFEFLFFVQKTEKEKKRRTLRWICREVKRIQEEKI